MKKSWLDRKADTRADSLFFTSRSFLKQLPTHIALLAKAPRAIAQTHENNYTDTLIYISVFKPIFDK